MRKLLVMVLIAAFCTGVFVACSGAKAAVALVTDGENADDASFDKGIWNGIVKYAEEKDVTKNYYTIKEPTADGALKAVSQAVKGGASLVVLPGALFESVLATAQAQYPQTTFILVDGVMLNESGTPIAPGGNATTITYADVQAGFLAGYAAVMDGLTQLGYLGSMEERSMLDYGYGYVQGAEYAAQMQGLPEGGISVSYQYLNTHEAVEAAAQTANAWYADGVEVIFTCGEKAGNAVMTAAEKVGGKVIGVDTDQSKQSPTEITSAVKNIGTSVYDVIAAYYTDAFPAGQGIMLDVSANGVGLALETAKFSTFTQADYDTIFAKLAANTDGITDNIKTSADVEAITDLPLTKMKLTIIE